MLKITLYRSLFLPLLLLLQYAVPAAGQQYLKQHMTMLASPEMKGRGPGTQQDSIVQSYICDVYSSSGFEFLPGMDSYYQQIGFTESARLTGYMQTDGPRGSGYEEHGTGFRFMRKTAVDSMSLDCVFIGYNVPDSIYTGGILAGKAVIAFQPNSFPTGDMSSDAIRGIRVNTMKAVRQLPNSGAGALLYVLPDGEIPEPQNSFGRFSGSGSYVMYCYITKEQLSELVGEKALKLYMDRVSKGEISGLPVDIPDTKVTLVSRVETDKGLSGNVLGVKRGLGDEYIIIGAHHDHLGERNGDVFAGANDNASGVAVLLDLAYYFRDVETDCNLLFCAFGLEERGLVGSKYFLDNCPVDKGKIKAMINLDMVGRLENDSLYQQNFNSEQWTGIFTKALDGKDMGLGDLVMPGGSSDHQFFAQQGIPSLFVSTGMDPMLHTPGDTEERINYEGMEKIFRFLVGVVEEVDVAVLK